MYILISAPLSSSSFVEQPVKLTAHIMSASIKARTDFKVFIFMFPPCEMDRLAATEKVGRKESLAALFVDIVWAVSCEYT
jgi:hypothetical protein